MASKIFYYLSSIITLALHVKNWRSITQLIFNRSSQPTTEVIVRLRNGLQFYVRSLMDVWIIKETCLDQDYEFGSFSGGTIIDIGAGLGDYAIYKAFFDPSAQVFAAEPFTESYELLKKNIILNQINNIEIAPIAIGAYSGEAVLADTGEAVQHTTTDSDVVGEGKNLMRVKSLSLDDFFEQKSIDYCQFLKIDCEGSEFDILMNASPQTLKKVKRIGLEYHDGYTEYTHQDLVQRLKKHNFEVTLKKNPVHSYLGFIFATQID